METTKSRLKKARDLYKAGDFAQAFTLCEEVLQTKADSYEACLLLGKVAYSLGDNAKAEKSYLRALEINELCAHAWQGLSEVFQTTNDYPKAIPVLQKLVELTKEDDAKNQGYRLKLSKLLAQAGQPEESAQILEELMLHAGLTSEIHLLALCQLADIQLAQDDSLLDARICEIFSSQEGLPDTLEENLDPAGLKARVMGEYMERSLHDSPVCKTLKNIVQMVAPFPPYVKYYDSYLLMFCKAIYCSGAQSVVRYNLRIQTLEQCYKMIFGKSGGCCTPLPFITALRLLEIENEILRVHKPGAAQDPSGLDASRRPSSAGSANQPLSSLRNLPAASGPDIEGKSIPTRWEIEQSHSKIQLGTLSRLASFDDDFEASPTANSLSPNRSLVGSPFIRSLHLRGSDTGGVTSEMELESHFLPTFMRSESLAVVRKLHRLGSGVLCDARDVIGDDVPRLLEVTEQVGCRMMHMFPWEAEIGVQLALALCRRKTPPEETKTVDSQERRVTNFLHVPKQITRVFQNKRESIIQLLKLGMKLGSKSASAIVATVELMLEEQRYEEALDICNQGVLFLHDRGARGGYPMVQASLTLQLRAANASLKLGQLDEAEKKFIYLTETVSEGEVSFGCMAGLPTSSIRQSAHRGLAHVSVARGNLIAARQKYEELLGASIMGKAPSVHWAEAEYGWILFEDGDTVRAKSHLERAVALARDNPHKENSCIGEYSFKLAKVYWSLGSKWRSNKAFAHTQLMQAAKVEGTYQADAFALLGIFYLEEEADRQKSRKCFQRALSLNPGQCDAGNHLLDMLIVAGTPLNKLMNFCKEILERDPSAEWALEGYGRIAHKLGDFQSAVVSFKSALKKKLDSAHLWERMGAAYQGMGRLTSSIKIFPLVQAGQLHAQLGEHRESLARFQQALDLDDSYPPTLLGMASTLLTLSKSYINLGAVEIAAELATQARDLAWKCTQEHGNVKLGWKLLGDIDYLYHSIHQETMTSSQGMEPQSALDIVSGFKTVMQQSCDRMQVSRRSYAHAVHLDPSEGTSWGDIASSCYQEARLQELQHKEGSDKDTSNLRMMSERLLRAGVYLDPTCVHLWEALGICGKDTRVREYALHRALQLSPKLVKAWVTLAKLYQDCGEHALAEECLEHARSHDPSAVSIWEGMAALATYQSPLDLFEHSLGLGGSPYSFLGYALHAVKNGRAKEPEVYACAMKAVKNFPLHPMAHHARGICEEFRGFPLKAVLSYEVSLILLRGENGISVKEGEWGSLTSEEVSVFIARARALCRGGKHSEGLTSYRSLLHNGKMDGKWCPQIGFGKALWEAGDVEDSVGFLINVIQSPAELAVRLDAVRALIHICVEEGKLTECGGLLDTVCHQIYGSNADEECKKMLPDFYLALLAGAYKIGRADLASLFAEKSRVSSKNLGIPEANVASQVYLIRHLALLSMESSDVKAIKSRIREAVHTAPWDVEARSYLSTEAVKSSFVNINALYSSNEDARLKALQQLRVDTSIMKKMVRKEPYNMEPWCSLSLLLLWAAQSSPTPKLFQLSLATCKIAQQIADPENITGPETKNRSVLQMQLLTIMSECISHVKRPNHDMESVKLAEEALELAHSLGDRYLEYAKGHMGRIHLHSGNIREGEKFLGDAVEGGCQAAAMELIAFLSSQGRNEEAKQMLHRYCRVSSG